MNTFKHLTYDEWIAEHPEVELEEVPCPICDGTGEDECPCCGHEIECEKCNGEGYITSARAIYEKQLAADKKALAKFLKGISQ